MADLDGFFFNVEKFFGSVSVQRMSFAEKGVYLCMLFQQWRDTNRNLPDDPQAVADLLAVTPSQVAEVLGAWDTVRRKFVTSDHTPARIWNVAVERTRRAQRANARKRREAGRAAGKASAAKRLTARELAVNERSTNVQRSSTDRRDKKDQIREIRNNTGTGNLPRLSRPDISDNKNCHHDPQCETRHDCIQRTLGRKVPA